MLHEDQELILTDQHPEVMQICILWEMAMFDDAHNNKDKVFVQYVMALLKGLGLVDQKHKRVLVRVVESWKSGNKYSLLQYSSSFVNTKNGLKHDKSFILFQKNVR